MRPLQEDCEEELEEELEIELLDEQGLDAESELFDCKVAIDCSPRSSKR